MAVVLPGSFIYLAHLHTGSEEVTEALKKIEGAFVAVNKRKGWGHTATLEQVKEICGDKLTGTEKVFTTIRHPYGVLTAMFEQNREHHHQMRALGERLGRDPNLKEFIELWLEMNAPPYMREQRLFYQKAQVHLRYEQLQMDIDALFRRLPNCPSTVPLPVKAPGPGHKHWSLFFDDPTYAFVNEKFQAEIANFGYSFIWSNSSLG